MKETTFLKRKVRQAAGTAGKIRGSSAVMQQYRFITRNRKSKWYDGVHLAQTHACRIGADFLDTAGNFGLYRGTVLEMRARPVR